MSDLRTILTIVLVCVTVENVLAGDTYLLDNSAGNYCGKTLKIQPNEDIILQSSGRAPSDAGFCSIVVYAVGKDEQNCHGMCMMTSSQFIDVCHAKVQFKGIDYGKDDDPFRELSCFKRLPAEWCFHNKVMTVEIVETYWYAFQTTVPGYNFTVKVTPLCDNSMHGKDIEAREVARREREESAIARSRNQGILVGICLAISFLVILLITWCYYKNKPFRRDVYNYPSATVRKGPTFAGFKAKMTFHKGTEEGEAKPKKVKKRKCCKDEATTENEETKPKKRGLGFLNKLRSSRAEEVPLVETKDVKAEGVEEKLEEIKEEENVDNKSDMANNDKLDESKVNEIGNSEEAVKEEKYTDEAVTNDDKIEAVETEKEEENNDSDPVPAKGTPSVTVTTPGDNENDSKNESSDDS